MADASVQVAFRLGGSKWQQIVVVDAEYTEDLGLVLEIIHQCIAQTGDFGVVKTQRLWLIAGYIGPVKHLQIDFGAFVKTGNVDQDLVP